jgi:hypothetical protein
VREGFLFQKRIYQIPSRPIHPDDDDLGRTFRDSLFARENNDKKDQAGNNTAKEKSEQKSCFHRLTIGRDPNFVNHLTNVQARCMRLLLEVCYGINCCLKS